MHGQRHEVDEKRKGIIQYKNNNEYNGFRNNMKELTWEAKLNSLVRPVK